MKVPFFDLNRLYIEQKSEIENAVNQALGSGHYILGSQGKKFETAMLQSLNAATGAEVIGCNSGTDALVLALLAAGVGWGDEVITVAHTAIPTITAIGSVGATPVFVDVDSASWVMDINKVLAEVTPKTKAVIAVHLYGNMVDVIGLNDLLQKHCPQQNIALIEDCAQAQGSKLQQRLAGTIGHFGAFSFYPSKNIGALGDAGAVLANLAADAARIRMLKNYGQKDRYNAIEPRGINSRLDEVQAAILAVRLPQLEKWNQIKTQLMSNYQHELAGLPLVFQTPTPECQPGWHLGVVKFESKLIRDQVQEYLDQQGIQTLIHYPVPTHKQKAFTQQRKFSLPVTENLADTILSLPMNSALTQPERETVVKSLKAFFTKN